MGIWKRIKVAATILFGIGPAEPTIVIVDDENPIPLPPQIDDGYQTLPAWLSGRKRTVRVTGRGPVVGMLFVETIDDLMPKYLGLIREGQVDPVAVAKFRRLAGSENSP